MKIARQREDVVDFGIKMLEAGLTCGTGGNLSVLDPDQNLVAITPSGIPYPEMAPEDVLVMTLEGDVIEGDRKPSSEAGFHLALYHHRPDVQAVVHTHSVYATTFACLNREILPVHYLVGFSGHKVPLAPYATYGTKELADSIVQHIRNYNAVLLANHGLVSVGKDLMSALNVAQEIEFVARVYYQAQSIGDPVILAQDQMDEVIEKFKDYGPQPK
ncbi:MAG: L-fuculose-phosphate aldolase [Desulfobacteraceae bacterium]|nr:MAG: L-fuculose-phosphate aldolase [Desulfobacteraceae bacterium]